MRAWWPYAIATMTLLCASRPALGEPHLPIPELELRLYMRGLNDIVLVDSRGIATAQRLPVYTAGPFKYASIIAHYTNFTIQRAAVSEELAPHVSGAPLQRFLEGTAKKGGFEVEPTNDLVKVGPHEALALRMQRPGPKGWPQWQYVTALTVNDHLYIFNLLSNEKPPWKNKPALNILARLRFGPVETE